MTPRPGDGSSISSQPPNNIPYLHMLAVADAVISGPGGAVALALVFFSIPFGFPYGKSAHFFHSMIEEHAWKRIDVLGAFLSLTASILLVFALQQGGVTYPWNSGAVIASFILSAILWAGFVIWERKLSMWKSACEPMFPWRLAINRFVLGLLM